jgi:23S rRNA pseudouridine1911/1915/1917 synthase
VTLPILGNDPSFIYLNKPAGLPTFPRVRGDASDCVLHRVLSELPVQGTVDWPDGFEGGLLHRLDNWTSGLLVVARTMKALELGRAAFVGGHLRKTYLFVSDGAVPWNEHRVCRPVAHHPRDRRKMVWQRGRETKHRGQWREAETQMTRIGATLWRAQITRGARHQIRLHAASVGLSLRGDRLYGGGGDGRFFLHHAGLLGWAQDAPVAQLPSDWPSAPEGLVDGEQLRRVCGQVTT